MKLIHSAAVFDSLAQSKPIVALESTIITHGMPWPQNLQVARQVEADVRAEGATPATIAVLNGTLHVGLEEEELETLAQAKNVAKLSRACSATAPAPLPATRTCTSPPT